MDVCLLDQGGEVLVPRHMQTDSEACLQALAPYRQGLGVAVECMCTWDWLADLCADQGSACVLGHALSMQASHGGKATNDQIEAQKMAQLLRGGRRPQAYGYPATRRATRDLLRRRLPRTYNRAALLAPVQNTHRQSNLPALGKKIASKANRDGVAARCAAPAVPTSSEVALALITDDDARLGNVALSILKTARHHDANPRSLLPTVPGIGTILRLGLLYAIHDIHRFPRGQDCLASCRLVKCRKAAAGKRLGPSGAKSGNAHRTWAFSDAAVLCLRDHPAAQQYLARLEQNPDKGQAFTLRAQQLARAVSSRLKRQGACDTETFFQRSGRGAEEPEASLDNQGHDPQRGAPYGGMPCVRERQSASRARDPEPCALLGQPLSLLFFAALVAHGQRGLLLTRAWRSRDNACALRPSFD
jgi:transposase